MHYQGIYGRSVLSMRLGSVAFAGISYLRIVYTNTRYNAPRSQELEAHLQGSTHANDLYSSIRR